MSIFFLLVFVDKVDSILPNKGVAKSENLGGASFRLFLL